MLERELKEYNLRELEKFYEARDKLPQSTVEGLDNVSRKVHKEWIIRGVDSPALRSLTISPTRQSPSKGFDSFAQAASSLRKNSALTNINASKRAQEIDDLKDDLVRSGEAMNRNIDLVDQFVRSGNSSVNNFNSPLA